ncbi:hypothetical protein GCM10009628_35890 [Paeniglutamicibacter kerguelensis]
MRNAWHLEKDHIAEIVRDGSIDTIGSLPAHPRDYLTWDRDMEMAKHKAFNLATDMDVTFCDRHSPRAARLQRTPTACCANISPKTPTHRSTAPRNLNVSPGNSMPPHDPGRGYACRVVS